MRNIGRYRLDRVLGAGAFATVWKGYDPDLRAPVAVKILGDNWTHNADVRERFLAEARILRRIRDPRVVRVHDVGVVEDRPYFVMDYVDGGTLADPRNGESAAEILGLAAQAANAVHALHDAGVIHRDVKPSNLLVDRSAVPVRVLAADLGSAKTLADASGYTVTTGTPAYMAPEQVGATGTLDARADVYALAVVTYELLAGTRPFAELSPSQLAHRTADVRPAPIARRTGLPPAIDRILVSALDPRPERRPRDAQTFAELLVALAHGRKVRVRSRREWPAPVVLGAALVAFALAGAITAWLR